MFLSVVYTVICVLLDFLLVPELSERAQTVELLALRHQVRVLRRQMKRTQ